jgi:hypothetical protein
MSEWPKYVSHKVVSAAPIVGFEYPLNPLPGAFPIGLVVSLPDGSTESFVTTEPMMVRRCTLGDYAMRYRDGYKSVCPKKEFEDGYTAQS